MNDETLRRRARTLAATLEPVIGQVFFSPECHAAYEKLGFAPSPGSFGNGVAAPDGAAYFTSRGSLLGQVQPEVVASAFGVFKPEAVAFFQRVIGRMKEEGCDAVVLGCTEIPLIMNDSNSPLPTLDSTRLLARAALRRAVHPGSRLTSTDYS